MFTANKSAAFCAAVLHFVILFPEARLTTANTQTHLLSRRFINQQHRSRARSTVDEQLTESPHASQ